MSQVCSEASSFEITTTHLMKCIDEIGVVLEWYRMIDEGHVLPPASHALTTTENLLTLQQMLRNLAGKLEEALVKLAASTSKNEATFPGEWALQWMKSCQIEDAHYAKDLVLEMRNVILLDQERKGLSGGVGVGGNPGHAHAPLAGTGPGRGSSAMTLATFADQIETLFSTLEHEDPGGGRAARPIHESFQCHLDRIPSRDRGDREPAGPTKKTAGNPGTWLILTLTLSQQLWSLDELTLTHTI